MICMNHSYVSPNISLLCLQVASSADIIVWPFDASYLIVLRQVKLSPAVSRNLQEPVGRNSAIYLDRSSGLCSLKKHVSQVEVAPETIENPTLPSSCSYRDNTPPVTIACTISNKPSSYSILCHVT